MSNDVLWFSSKHPHYTPEWLSLHMARRLPLGSVDYVLDPACGAGNLLAAVASVAAAEGVHPLLRGIDKSRQAINKCTLATKSGSSAVFDFQQADFLRMKDPVIGGRGAIIMNPPFKGYGILSKRDRSHIRRSIGLEGRFNLAHAFVVRALRVYRPAAIVALLPSNWHSSAAAYFKDFVRTSSTRWTWTEVGDSAFPLVNTHVGILEMIPTPRPMAPKQTRQSVGETLGADPRFELRNGVATGNDEAFLELASWPPAIGSVVNAIRGRDIQFGSSRLIWMANERVTDEFSKQVSASILGRLRARSCVREGSRAPWQYHDKPPSWFLGEPKVVLSEVSVTPRIMVDDVGRFLPLHSTVAIRAPSAKIAARLGEHLGALLTNNSFRSRFQQMSGGAIRLSVSGLRQLPSL